ncbi:VanZ family protein [uncultured Thomasclavelia sp.]|uniref:VanZ family protein n=1 Tax=uncultured Thomasclavelia sp. TaxID=3025759 RepID=UPI0025D06ECC|nr:VanZ family protein [uncultured Thomasclavelia sp.]
MKKIRYFIPMFIWMLFIFLMSQTNGNDSSSQSNFIVDIIIKIINIDHDTLSLIVRKCAHFTEYTILAFLIYYGLAKNQVNNKSILLYTVLITFAYACSDEFHQLFINGRSGQFKDVLIDTSGVIFICLWHYLKKSKS